MRPACAPRSLRRPEPVRRAGSGRDEQDTAELPAGKTPCTNHCGQHDSCRHECHAPSYPARSSPRSRQAEERLAAEPRHLHRIGKPMRSPSPRGRSGLRSRPPGSRRSWRLHGHAAVHSEPTQGEFGDFPPLTRAGDLRHPRSGFVSYVSPGKLADRRLDKCPPTSLGGKHSDPLDGARDYAAKIQVTASPRNLRHPRVGPRRIVTGIVKGDQYPST